MLWCEANQTTPLFPFQSRGWVEGRQLSHAYSRLIPSKGKTKEFLVSVPWKWRGKIDLSFKQRLLRCRFPGSCNLYNTCGERCWIKQLKHWNTTPRFAWVSFTRFCWGFRGQDYTDFIQRESWWNECGDPNKTTVSCSSFANMQRRKRNRNVGWCMNTIQTERIGWQFSNW